MAHLEPAGGGSTAAPLDSDLTVLDIGATRRWSSLLVGVGLLLVWEALTRIGVLSALYFPAPSTILGSLAQLVRTGELARHGGTTLYRLGVGLLTGGVSGFLIGVVMGRSDPIRRLVDPVVGALYPIPKIAILPLVMVFLGIGETSKLFVIALAAFFPMLIATMGGVRQIPAIYFEVAENYGTGRWNLLKRVILPASLPTVLSGARIGLNSVIHVTIAVEIVSAVRGLGALVWLSWEVLRVEQLYATLAVIAFLGVASTAALDRVTRSLVPWRE